MELAKYEQHPSRSRHHGARGDAESDRGASGGDDGERRGGARRAGIIANEGRGSGGVERRGGEGCGEKGESEDGGRSGEGGKPNVALQKKSRLGVGMGHTRLLGIILGTLARL